MDQFRKMGTRKTVLASLFLVLAFALWVRTNASQNEAFNKQAAPAINVAPHAKTSESENETVNLSCFFCHMDVIAEMKAHAVKHWDADTQCATCHGKSVGHVDVEDNSIKPDKVWNNATVHGLCKECHQGAFARYGSSSHARLAMGAQPNTAKAPSCSSCHGYHAFKSEVEMKKQCLSCHPTLPGACTSRPGSAKEQAFPCKECHDSHSLLPVRRN